VQFHTAIVARVQGGVDDLHPGPLGRENLGGQAWKQAASEIKRVSGLSFVDQ
jgi:hypothetical protein